MLEVKSCGFVHLSKTKLNVLNGFSITILLKKVSLHGLGRQVPFVAVLKSFVFLKQISIESKWLKVSNCLAFIILLGSHNHIVTLEASSLIVSLESLKVVYIKVSNFDTKERFQILIRRKLLY